MKDDREMIKSKFESALKQSKIFEVSHRLRMQDRKTLKWVNLMCRLKQFPNGKVEKIYGTIQDITKWRAAIERDVYVILIIDICTLRFLLLYLYSH